MELQKQEPYWDLSWQKTEYSYGAFITAWKVAPKTSQVKSACHNLQEWKSFSLTTVSII